MQFFEIPFTLVTLILLVITSFYGRLRKFQQILFVIGLIVFVSHLLFEIIRWQMILTYLVFVIVALFILRKSISHIIFRLLGFILGMLFIFISSFYAIGMPIMKLPSPSGKYSVGTTSFSIIDETRSEIHTDDPSDKRELYVEMWYPGKIQDKVAANSLWRELYSGQLDNISFFMKYLKGIKTHSFPDIAPYSDESQFPLILFNHALQMFTAQNTMLMEHLASHGYIIASVAHPYESLRVNLSQKGTVLPEFLTSLKKFNEAMAWIQKSSSPVLAARDSMQFVTGREKRSRIMLNAIKNAELNTVVEEWTLDNSYVLDRLLAQTENPFSNHALIDTARIGIMGMSIGGATAGEFCKVDSRVKAGINVDGLQYGTRHGESLNVPFMMIYSEDGLGLNDFLMLNSKNDYYEYHFKNARHTDFTDLVLVWPFLRVYGQLGDTPGKRMIQITNKVILNFWDHYLKQQPYYEFLEADYPELNVVMKHAPNSH